MRVGDGNLAAEIEQRAILSVNPAVGLGVHPTDEEGGHRGESVDRLAGANASLQGPHIGLGHLTVMLQRKEQRDVDVDAAGDQLPHRRRSLDGARNLDEQVRPVDSGPQALRLRNRGARVIRRRRGNLDRHVSVGSIRGIVDAAEGIAGITHVGRRDELE